VDDDGDDDHGDEDDENGDEDEEDEGGGGQTETSVLKLYKVCSAEHLSSACSHYQLWLHGAPREGRMASLMPTI
jgi:hypothetical protein